MWAGGFPLSDYTAIYNRLFGQLEANFFIETQSVMQQLNLYFWLAAVMLRFHRYFGAL